MTEDQKPEPIVFSNVDDAIEHVQKLEKEARDAVSRYHQAVKEFTGIVPGSPLNPMDIVKICMRFRS